MTKTELSLDYVCVFCDSEYYSNPLVCCDEYKGIMTSEDAAAYYPELYVLA